MGGKAPFSSYLKDKSTDLVLWSIFTVFEIYSVIATIILKIFLPITKYMVKRKLKSFDVEINGNRPWDIEVLKENETVFYPRVAIEGAFGFMEGMMDKICSTRDFKGLISKIMITRRQREIIHPLTWIFETFNLQSKTRSWEVGVNHYDAGNDIIESMLDKNLQYTCGYWANGVNNLEEAQIAKMDLIARKLMLKPGLRVLDIGSGYGTLALYLAKNYGVSVVGVTISEAQIKFSENLCKGFPCEFRLCDYRDLDEKFDRIVSVGMFEHVGPFNYIEFFKVCHRCCSEEGIFLLHTIGNLHKKLISRDAWINKYIFVNSSVPYYMEICKAIENLWIIEDWQNFGFDYSKTLAEWEKNFDKSWPKHAKKYGERFYIMWKMYLQAAQATTATRSLHLFQIVMSKDGIKGGYHAPR